MATRKRKVSAKLSADERMILGPFLEAAEKGEKELAEYLVHVGIRSEDIEAAGDAQSAILAHYRRPGGRYDIDAAAADLAQWPPIAARIEELKRAAI